MCILKWADDELYYYAAADESSMQSSDGKYKTRRTRVKRPCLTFNSVCYSHIF